LAYERYADAAALPVADTALARARQSLVVYCLTPTPTPSVTPTPSATPTLTPIPPPTEPPPPTPTPTPWPLNAFRNKIVFWREIEESEDFEEEVVVAGAQEGWWLMDPNGENEQYLGMSGFYHRQYNELRERETYSPDGRYRVYTTEADPAEPQLWMYLPKHDTYGDLPPRQLTRLTGLCYDAVWSPDGSRIAFTSQENGSDDVWVIYPDGTGGRPLVTNDWEWDKHPSWSPDSRRIVFWSNRSGLKQIYIMDAEGRNVQNISSNQYNEYDPMWIK
jgi:TolB protein